MKLRFLERARDGESTSEARGLAGVRENVVSGGAESESREKAFGLDSTVV